MRQLRNVSAEIETLIDETSLLHVLTAIELVCGEKAEHIRHNWQDKQTARHWDDASKALGRVLRHKDVQDL